MKFAQAVLNFILPPKCLSCKTVVDRHGNICAQCWQEMKVIGAHKCHICGLPFNFDMGKKAVCSHCAADKPKFNKAGAFCRYEGTARRLAIGLKYADRLYLAPHLAKMMMAAEGGLVKKADLIVPVPLYYRRKFIRRYNQSALLAKNIAVISGKRYKPFLLKRIKNTRQQTRLHWRDRQANVANAFVVEGELNGRNILLIDDVMTTGATLSSCAKVLKENGAKKVYCLVFARVESTKSI